MIVNSIMKFIYEQVSIKWYSFTNITHSKEFISTWVNKCNGYVILNSTSIQNDVLADGFVLLKIEVKINYELFID